MPQKYSILILHEDSEVKGTKKVKQFFEFGILALHSTPLKVEFIEHSILCHFLIRSYPGALKWVVCEGYEYSSKNAHLLPFFCKVMPVLNFGH